jgi:hypothetical protein
MSRNIDTDRMYAMKLQRIEYIRQRLYNIGFNSTQVENIIYQYTNGMLDRPLYARRNIQTNDISNRQSEPSGYDNGNSFFELSRSSNNNSIFSPSLYHKSSNNRRNQSYSSIYSSLPHFNDTNNRIDDDSLARAFISNSGYGNKYRGTNRRTNGRSSNRTTNRPTDSKQTNRPTNSRQTNRPTNSRQTNRPTNNRLTSTRSTNRSTSQTLMQEIFGENISSGGMLSSMMSMLSDNDGTYISFSTSERTPTSNIYLSSTSGGMVDFVNSFFGEDGSIFRNIFSSIPTTFTNILNQNNVAVVLSNDEVNKLESEKLSYNDLVQNKEDITGKCTICLQEYNTNDKNKKQYIKLPCNHIFHDSCIIEWLKNYNYKCPICRKECGEHYAKL